MPLSPSRHARAPAEARVDPSILKLTKLHYVEAPAIQVRMFGSNVVKPKCINIFSKYADPNWDCFFWSCLGDDSYTTCRGYGRTHPIRARCGPCWKHRSCIQLPTPDRWCTHWWLKLIRTWLWNTQVMSENCRVQEKTYTYTVTYTYIYYVHCERHPKFWTSPTSAKILDSISPWGNDNIPLPTSWERAATAKFFRLHKKRHSYYIDLHQSSQHGVKKQPPICSDQDNKRVLTVRGLNLSQKVAGFWCSSSALGRNCKECFLGTFHWIRDTALINTNWLATKIIALRSQRYLKALLGILKQNSRDIFLARDLDSHNNHVRPAESASILSPPRWPHRRGWSARRCLALVRGVRSMWSM